VEIHTHTHTHSYIWYIVHPLSQNSKKCQSSNPLQVISTNPNIPNVLRLWSIIITDIDNNGWLDKHDFECMALRMTLIEGKGEFNCNRYQENLHIMLSLWEEITDLADFDKVRSTFLFFLFHSLLSVAMCRTNYARRSRISVLWEVRIFITRRRKKNDWDKDFLIKLPVERTILSFVRLVFRMAS